MEELPKVGSNRTRESEKFPAAYPCELKTLGSLAAVVNARLGQVAAVAQLGVVALPSSATRMVVETAPLVVGVP
jgi:hypothetical protein